MTIEILPEQKKIFDTLMKNKDKDMYVLDIVKLSEVEQPMVMGTLKFCQEQEWVEIKEEKKHELVFNENLNEIIQKKLPERIFIENVLKENPELEMKEVAQKCKELNLKVNEVIKWGTLKEWIKKENLKKGKGIILTELGKKYLEKEDEDEKVMKLYLEKREKLEKDYEKDKRFSKYLFLEELGDLGIDVKRVEKLLKKRTEIVKIKERIFRKVRLTSKGKEEIPKLKVKEQEKNILTSEDIISGKWKEIKLREYDVTLKAESVYPKKIHPLQKIIQETRKTFLQMGFKEIVSPHVESCFWDFDALFQPQDHPSRDMQDTFYLKYPDLGKLPSKSIVDKVKSTHENGWKTGSTGWGYKWNEKEAKKMILRTHTTATSIRAIAQNPNPPQKLFCVGRVFRNETISFKHLPEFHQVDGIIIDESSNFSCLLGTLKEFYKKMGFEKVKFKPAFFPYTEPSAEVFVWMKSKKCWIELGGCGIFRPEVTMPFGCKVPVLAWGLGLERLAMLRYGVNDIRILYGSDLDWLRKVKLSQ